MPSIGIFGSSGMAEEVADICLALGHTPVFVLPPERPSTAGRISHPYIFESDVCNHLDFHYVIAIGDNSIRKKIADRYIGLLTFTNLIHPDTTLGSGQRECLKSVQGSIFCPGVRLTTKFPVGNFCIFNQNATVAHDCVIEDFVNLAPGANVSGNVWLERGVWIGSGAVINNGTLERKLKVGQFTTVGSGSVVTADCDAYALYYGNPARRQK